MTTLGTPSERSEKTHQAPLTAQQVYCTKYGHIQYRRSQEGNLAQWRYPGEAWQACWFIKNTDLDEAAAGGDIYLLVHGDAT